MTQRYRDGGGAECAAAYSRAVRRGAFIAALHPGDTAAQTHVCFERALLAVDALGNSTDDVIRTRILLSPEADPSGAIAVHRALFEGREPASTVVYVGGFIPEGVLVEVELDALVEEP